MKKSALRKKRILLYCLGSAAMLGLGLIVLLSSTYPISGPTTNREIIQVLATVLPQRIIIVDSNLKIQEIWSNSSQETQPKAFLESVNGTPEPYAGTIEDQYSQLKAKIDFSKSGAVYIRDNHPILSFFKRIWQAILNWL